MGLEEDTYAHQHPHISRTAEASTTSPKARLVIIVLLAFITALTAVGAYVLRPDWEGLEHVQALTGYQTAPGVSRERAEILEVEHRCESATLAASGTKSCVTLTVQLTTGEDAEKEAVTE